MLWWTDKRFQRGAALWKAGKVEANGARGQYYVQGSARYLTASAWAACGERCTCPDYSKRGKRCKHVVAANLAEAEARIMGLMAKGWTLERVHEYLTGLGIQGVKPEHEPMWEALMWVVWVKMGVEPQGAGA